MKSKPKNENVSVPVASQSEKPSPAEKMDLPHLPLEALTKPTGAFTQALAREIVKNLTNFGHLTARPFQRKPKSQQLGKLEKSHGEFPLLIDTSVCIDGRILSIANSGFLVGTLLVPQFALREIQYIADSADMLRRMKGRRGLDVVNKLKGLKSQRVKTKIINDDPVDIKEVDHKLVALARKWNIPLVTVDFNLAHLARAEGVKVFNVNDLAQALKMAIVAGEELSVKITHEGKEREQGVGYLGDGTMIVVDNAKDKVGSEVVIVVTKIHQTAAGQLFFARLK